MRTAAPARCTALCALWLAVPALPAGAQSVDGDTFAEWTVKCEPLPQDSSESCFVFQNRVLRGTSQRILHTAVGYLPGDSEPVMLFTTPLGVALPQGITLRLDGEPVAQAAFQVCETQGCRAGLRLNAAILERLNAAETASVLFLDNQRRELELPLTLDGLDDALKALPR